MVIETVQVYSSLPMPDDPFRYGWRNVQREHPDGTTTWERVPLTLEDVLHPQEEDFAAQSVSHQLRQRYLQEALAAQLADDPTAVVVADLLIAWDTPDLKPHAPDIAVIVGVRAQRNWSTFHVAEEGTHPSLLIEITSPSTASLDRSVKLDEYGEAGVETYVLIDTQRFRRRTVLRLVGYTLTPEGYRLLAPNAQGWLWLEVARTWLCIEDNEIVCRDASGRPIGDYLTLAAALRDAERRATRESEARVMAERRADTAEQRATAAESQVRALEAELRRLRGA